MFKRERRGHGKWIGIVSGAIAGAAAIAAAVPVLKKRALSAITILKKDHRAVRFLFGALRHTTNPSIRKSIFRQIRSQIETHMWVEEEIFYPAVRNIFTSSAEQQVDQARLEHQQIKDLLHQVAIIDPNSFSFMSKINELKDVIENHVDIEENQMFPFAHDNMSSEEIEYLGQLIHDQKLEFKEKTAA
jgi:iron-sulfur cluster repair protein YtfE (RIC family)